MTNPKFRTGETVYFGGDLNKAAGTYIIVRAMPEKKACAPTALDVPATRPSGL
jgi:hypothetical protein